MRHSKMNSKRGGFTRAEAVAIVGVAGALGALVMPVAAQGTILDLIFGRGNSSGSRSGSCQSNLKQIGLGLAQYAQDYDEKMVRATSKGPEFGWAQSVQPYIKSVALLQCPAEKNVKGEDEGTMVSAFKKAGYTDYWLNSRVSGREMFEFDALSQTIALGDGDGGSAASTARYNIRALPTSWKQTPRSPARRHVRSKVEGANYAFVDGHVKWYPHTDISNAELAEVEGKPTFSIE